MPGQAARSRRIVSAKMPAPPSSRSSRATEVIDDVFEAQTLDRFRDTARFVEIVNERLARLDRAEPAGPSAGVSQDHDRGGPLIPAFAHVGAVRLLADGVERQPVE